jgi:hypothetical protein
MLVLLFNHNDTDFNVLKLDVLFVRCSFAVVGCWVGHASRSSCLLCFPPLLQLPR